MELLFKDCIVFPFTFYTLVISRSSLNHIPLNELLTHLLCRIHTVLDLRWSKIIDVFVFSNYLYFNYLYF